MNVPRKRRYPYRPIVRQQPQGYLRWDRMLTREEVAAIAREWKAGRMHLAVSDGRGGWRR